MKLVVTAVAELDLEEIEEYISSDNPAAAIRLLELLFERFTLLAKMPDIGRQRENYGKGVRSIAEGAYIIIYRVKNKRLEILRVLHGARDPERVIEDEPIKD